MSWVSFWWNLYNGSDAPTLSFFSQCTFIPDFKSSYSIQNKHIYLHPVLPLLHFSIVVILLSWMAYQTSTPCLSRKLKAVYHIINYSTVIINYKEPVVQDVIQPLTRGKMKAELWPEGVIENILFVTVQGKCETPPLASRLAKFSSMLKSWD